MIVYLAVFSIAVSVAAAVERSWKTRPSLNLPRGFAVGALLVAVPLVGVSALRWRVGTDYRTYEESFSLYAAEFQNGPGILEEPGLRFIAWLAMKINGDSATMFAIAALLTIGLTVASLWRWSPAFALSIAFYILSGAWHGSFNGVRQYIACAILFAGHRLIIDRKFAKWMGIILVASLFHTSAVIGILFYLLPTKRTSFGLQALLLGLGIVGTVGMDSLLVFLESFTGDSNRWGGSYAEREINPLRVAFNFLPIALFWLLKVKDKVHAERAWFYVNILVVHAAIFLASMNSALMARFAIYTLPFLAFGLVYVTWVKEPRERALIRMIVLLLYAVFMYVNISTTTNLRDFQWIFERP